MQSPILFAPGTLWNAIVARSRAALERGALHPIATHRHTVPDEGVLFQVRVVSSLARYRDDNAAKRQRAENGNPFLPYEADLFVTDVTRTHLCLLNKYNVIANHTLIVTRAFEPQESPLTLKDFQALCACLREFKALGFYNSGPGAGASQPHKHLQLVPLPLADAISLPIEALFPSGGDHGARLRIENLPFVHGFVRLSAQRMRDPAIAANYAFAIYRTLLEAVGLLPPARAMPQVLAPYNLLATETFMLLIPRSRASFRSIAVNALGFAGSFFVSDEEVSRAIAEIGPLRLLREVTVPSQLPG